MFEVAAILTFILFYRLLLIGDPSAPPAKGPTPVLETGGMPGSLLPKAWNAVRSAGLLAILFAVALSLCSTLLFPTPLEHPSPTFPFSAGNPLPGWQSDESFVVSDYDAHGFPLRARYRTQEGRMPTMVEVRYTEDSRNLYDGAPGVSAVILPSGYLPLDIGMRILVDAHGEIRSNSSDPQPSAGTVKPIRRKVGDAYGLWTHAGRLHLSAVLGAGGVSVVTRPEYSRAIYGKMLNGSLLLRAFLGKARLPDPRCLVFDLSVPDSANAPDVARRQLEEAWEQWRGWCIARFPE